MNLLATTAVALALSAAPALAQGAPGDMAAPQGSPSITQQQAPSDGLTRHSVMGADVYSADGQSIGQVVDALETPEGDLVAVAVVDPNDPAVGLALPAEMLSEKDGRLTADITTDEIAALPEPEEADPSDIPMLEDEPRIDDGAAPVEQ